MNTENENGNQSSCDAENQSSEPRKMSRREALALVGKHAAYTAPAVLAVLSVTKSTSAYAIGSATCDPDDPNCKS